MTKTPKLRNAKRGEWSSKKIETARALSEGTETQAEIARRLNLKEPTISRWKREPEFLKRIDELTLTLERHSLAGMLRRLDEQQEKTKIGKNEWLKIEEFKARLHGFDKKTAEHPGTIVMIIDNIPENKNIKPIKKSGETD